MLILRKVLSLSVCILSGNSTFPKDSIKSTKFPTTVIPRDMQQLAVPSRQEDGRAVKKLIMERMAWPSEISNPAQEYGPLRTPQGMATIGGERVGNFAPVRQPRREFPSRPSSPKPLTHSDLLTSFMMLRQQQDLLVASEKASTTLTGTA